MTGSGGGHDTGKVAWRSVASLTYARSLMSNDIEKLKECQDGQ